jgi:hypothetical protein
MMPHNQPAGKIEELLLSAKRHLFLSLLLSMLLPKNLFLRRRWRIILLYTACGYFILINRFISHTAEVSNVIEAGNKVVFSFRFSRVHNSPEGKSAGFLSSIRKNLVSEPSFY